MGRVSQGPEPPPKSAGGGDRREEVAPYAFVHIRGHVTLSEDLEELLRFATAIGGRYMGADRAAEFGRRNAVPGELLVRLRPRRVIATADVASQSADPDQPADNVAFELLDQPVQKGSQMTKLPSAAKQRDEINAQAATPGDKARVGDVFPTVELTTTSGEQVTVPDSAGDFVHLQLRRFAGCPICNLHLRSIVARYDEIRSRGIREVVVFHSTAAELAKHEAELPFPLIADPQRELYRRLGVGRQLSSLLRLRALRAAFAGETAAFGKRSTKRGALGPVKPTGGRLGLPADFLIAPDGQITALKYGRHAYDQWTVDELLEHAGPAPAHAPTRAESALG